MRKIGMVLAMLVCTMMAQAGEYAYLVFTNTSGTTTALTVSNLSATVSGSTLVVTNDDGTVNFTLTDLAAMQFSKTDTLTALDNVLDGNQAVKVYSISGTSFGTFDNLVQAAQQLGAGAYVISNGKNSQTIVVK
ncbi:MAG: hypothetical protein II605_00925 [Paludibacteraceae bacterium]|nr:hypothetical protein [Paludibacteraceae bacterium]MBQ2189744.1 hypothetical protein [Paludibacteraceae bacterium]MBQ2520392.1 hypothetical protein [Paludibacteraceae bacterium]MBQ4017786.1 hypothetical protein [Paludibacteraceae bacterium]